MRVVDYHLLGSLTVNPPEKMLRGFVPLAVVKNHWTVVKTNHNYEDPKANFVFRLLVKDIFVGVERSHLKVQKVFVFFVQSVKQLFVDAVVLFDFAAKPPSYSRFVFGFWQKSWENK